MAHNTSDQGKWKMIIEEMTQILMKPCWMMMMMEKNIKHPEEKKGKGMFFWTYKERIWGLVTHVGVDATPLAL